MANLNQFYKGEAIKITVADDKGKALVGEYSSTGVKGPYDGLNFKYAGLRAYPDDLNLDNGESSKIKPFMPETSESEAGKVFSIAGDVSKTMEEGQYTVELIYGTGDNDRTIVKTNHAFTLVGSAFKREN